MKNDSMAIRPLLALGFIFCISLPIVFSLVQSQQVQAKKFCWFDNCNQHQNQKQNTTEQKLRRIAYYESWASRRPCSAFHPFQVNADEYTHINFAFALVDEEGRVNLSSPNDTDLYNELKHLREQQTSKTSPQLWIVVGGFGVSSVPFSKMASANASRAAFVDSALQFVEKYDFDGLDLDWEYPGAKDKGGNDADKADLVLLLEEMKPRFEQKGKGLSLTVPGSEYYMTGFDLKGIEPHIDWINVMSYDLHGPWDAPPVLRPHTNLTEINTSIQTIKKAVPAEKINLGLAYYGHTFVLSNSSCTTPGCPSSGAGKKGNCSLEAGTLINSEIEDLLSTHHVKITFDHDDAVKYFVLDDEWMTYDDNETIGLKEEYAVQQGLGTFIWAVDMGRP
ncbi:hypothetical protein ASPZODRAFT_750405 [Penicilliopsis zonata CBS 506.65]|uniref:chitinase n=1 Tax=Penicilliopsis zonata CBS 506.65 TaxID=1073090 RepID=A0A1L9SAL8_9EURO|nr:hypothetical protein ASPZODRAFT_750405 [Penicilliopsis zonata CBS 506.65]OJJ44223.1 hypothetical protein ASPZODRAFT_750405 [Penicilliopsis zonata CBS 506.65]